MHIGCAHRGAYSVVAPAGWPLRTWLALSNSAQESGVPVPSVSGNATSPVQIFGTALLFGIFLSHSIFRFTTRVWSLPLEKVWSTYARSALVRQGT